MQTLNNFFVSNNIEYLWSTLKSIIHEAISLYVPLFGSRIRAYPQWFSPNLRHCLNKLHTLRRKFRKSSTANRATSLLQAESQFQKAIIEVKSSYESRLINDYVAKDNTKIFKYIRSITKQDSIPSSVFYDHQSAINDTDKAILFNSFVHSVFKSSHIPASTVRLSSSSCLIIG